MIAPSAISEKSHAQFWGRVLVLAQLLARHRYDYSWVVYAAAVVRPLVDLAFLFFVFGHVLKMPVAEYIVYLACGLVPWGFFRRGIAAATSILIVRKPLILHVGMSPAVLPLAAVTTEFAKFLVAFGILLVLVFSWFRTPQPVHLMLPVALLPLVVSTYALGVAAAFFAVLRRGLSHMIPLVLMAVFWFTPVVYHWSLLPDWLQPVVRYNPFTLLLSGTQVILHGNTLPSLELLALSYLVSGVTVAVAVGLFRRIRAELPFRL